MYDEHKGERLDVTFDYCSFACECQTPGEGDVAQIAVQADYN